MEEFPTSKGKSCRLKLHNAVKLKGNGKGVLTETWLIGVNYLRPAADATAAPGCHKVGVVLSEQGN